MFLPSINDNVSRNTPAYVFEIQQLFQCENVPVGTEYAMLAIADGLTRETELRRNLGRTLQAIIHREGGQINAMELLSLILMASASLNDSLPSDQMERAMYETLGFILEVRQPLQNPRECDLGPGMITGTERLSSRSEPRPSAWPLEKGLFGTRNRVMPVLALCGMLAAFLIFGIARHRQQATQNSAAQTHALPASGAANAPDSIASGGREPLPSHHSPRRSKASVPRPEKSDAPTQTAPSATLATLASPVREFPLHSAGASANKVSSSVPNSTTRFGGTGASPTHPRAVATVDMSTNAVAPATSVGRPRPVAVPRALVQSGSAGIMAANLISSPTPAYPAAASEANVEGEVTVNALIGKDGNVLSATVISGPLLLREAALKAVEKWQYHPYLVSGKPAVMATTAILDFQLARD